MRRVCGANPGGLSWADDWSLRVRGGVLSPAQGQCPWEVTGLVSAGTAHIWRRLKAFNSRPRQEVSVSHRGTPQFSVLPPDFSLLPAAKHQAGLQTTLLGSSRRGLTGKPVLSETGGDERPQRANEGLKFSGGRREATVG